MEEKKRIRLRVAYDGTRYAGWQIQQNALSVEEVLTKTLQKLLHEDILLIGASRTDSGVHAEGNLAVFDTASKIPPEKFAYALNMRLPADISVTESDEVSPEYHPRKRNTVKTYEYRILNRHHRDPLLRLYSHFYYYPLDTDRMREAAKALIGVHDFRSFCATGAQIRENYVRELYSIEIVEEGDLVRIFFRGSGFLYNMVRIMAGVLLRVGCGMTEPSFAEELLYARDRSRAGAMLPARGLILKSIEEREDLTGEKRVEEKEWAYSLCLDENKNARIMIDRILHKEDIVPTIVRLLREAEHEGAVSFRLILSSELEAVLPDNPDTKEWRIGKGRECWEAGRR